MDESNSKLDELFEACKNNNISSVRSLLLSNEFELLIKGRDKYGRSLLHYTAECTHDLCIKQVLSLWPQLLCGQDNDGYTVLHLAIINGNHIITNYLCKSLSSFVNETIYNKFLNCGDNEGHTAFHWATVCNELECMDILYNSGALPCVPDIHGATALHYAAQMSSPKNSISKNVIIGLQVLEKLLKYSKIDPNCKDKDGRTPILWAASSGSSDAILTLYNAGADISSCDKDGLTALHCAASRNHLDCVEIIIHLCGSDIDILDSLGCSPLFYAVTVGHADCTQMLLANGADPNRQDTKGRTAAHCGALKGQFETIKILSQYKANLWIKNIRGDLPLHEAIKSGRKDLVKWLLEQHPCGVNIRNSNGRTPLHIAAINNNLEMCQILFDLGAEASPIMKIRGHLITPLDAALSKGYRNCAKLLLLHGALPATRVNANRSMNSKLEMMSFNGNKTPFAENHRLSSIANNKSDYVGTLSNEDSTSTTHHSHSIITNVYVTPSRIPSFRYGRCIHTSSNRICRSIDSKHNDQEKESNISDFSRLSESDFELLTSNDNLDESDNISGHHIDIIKEKYTNTSTEPRKLKKKDRTDILIYSKKIGNNIRKSKREEKLTHDELKYDQKSIKSDNSVKTMVSKPLRKSLKLKSLKIDNKSSNNIRKTNIFEPDTEKTFINNRSENGNCLHKDILSKEKTLNDKKLNEKFNKQPKIIKNRIKRDYKKSNNNYNILSTNNLSGKNKISEEIDHSNDENFPDESNLDSKSKEISDFTINQKRPKKQISNLYYKKQKNKNQQQLKDKFKQSQIYMEKYQKQENQEKCKQGQEEELGEYEKLYQKEKEEKHELDSQAPEEYQESQFEQNEPEFKQQEEKQCQQESQSPEFKEYNKSKEKDHEWEQNKQEYLKQDKKQEKSNQRNYQESEREFEQNEPEFKQQEEKQCQQESQSPEFKEYNKSKEKDHEWEQNKQEYLKQDKKQEKSNQRNYQESEREFEQNEPEFKQQEEKQCQQESQSEFEKHNSQEGYLKHEKYEQRKYQKQDEKFTEDATKYQEKKYDNSNGKQELECQLLSREEDEYEQQQQKQYDSNDSRDQDLALYSSQTSIDGSLYNGSDIESLEVRRNITKDINYIDNNNNNYHNYGINNNNYHCHHNQIPNNININNNNNNKNNNNNNNNDNYNYNNKLSIIETKRSDSKCYHRLHYKERIPSKLSSINLSHVKAKVDTKGRKIVHRSTENLNKRDLDNNKDLIMMNVEKSIRKYQMERKLFEELQTLKRYQIRSDRVNEPMLVKRMVTRFRKDSKMPGMGEFKDIYTYRAYERYLYDELRKLSSSNNKKVLPLIKSTSNENLPLCYLQNNQTNLEMDKRESVSAMSGFDSTMNGRTSVASNAETYLIDEKRDNKLIKQSNELQIKDSINKINQKINNQSDLKNNKWKKDFIKKSENIKREKAKGEKINEKFYSKENLQEKNDIKVINLINKKDMKKDDINPNQPSHDLIDFLKTTTKYDQCVKMKPKQRKICLKTDSHIEPIEAAKKRPKFKRYRSYIPSKSEIKIPVDIIEKRWRDIKTAERRRLVKKNKSNSDPEINSPPAEIQFIYEINIPKEHNINRDNITSNINTNHNDNSNNYEWFRLQRSFSYPLILNDYKI